MRISVRRESIAGEATRETFTLEGRYRNGAGEYRWLKSTSSPRFGPDGEHVGFIGAATDITVAKEAELELRRSVAEQTAQLAAYVAIPPVRFVFTVPPGADVIEQ